MNRREDIEARERSILAPYGMRSENSRGQQYPTRPHPLRTAFQRDRDRIVHSAAFRRMEHKTQVFLPSEADHYRTRLTHTMEVAQISRTLSRALGVNEDLTEAIALVHDVGHTPFGHVGEDILNNLLADHDGFNHNRQSLRVVDLLEQRYAEHPGLNLSYEVREGIVKHETSMKIEAAGFDLDTRPTLEASLVDRADEIAYNAHDVDDGLNSGLLVLKDLLELDVWGDMEAVTGMSSQGRAFLSLADDQKRHVMVRYLIDMAATALLQETQRRLDSNRISSPDDVRKSPRPICAYPEATDQTVLGLKTYLMERLYRHPDLIARFEWAEEIISSLYRRLNQEPELLPRRFQEMTLTQGPEIVVADYIAGMTDRFAVRLYQELDS